MTHGKAKQMFEEWICINHQGIWVIYNILPLVCQQALIVEWLDSVGIIITINYHTEASYRISNKDGSKDIYSGLCGKTRPEATQKAIEKSIEILNSRL